jgi:hypothetical protein
MMTPEEKDKQAKITPAIRDFVSAIEKAGLVTSALIFDPEGDFLIKCGNAAQEGKEFVRLHYFLSLVVAQLDASGHYTKDDVDLPADIDTSENSRNVADRLVMALLSMPAEMLPERIVTLAQEYADARKG